MRAIVTPVTPRAKGDFFISRFHPGDDLLNHEWALSWPESRDFPDVKLLGELADIARPDPIHPEEAGKAYGRPVLGSTGESLKRPDEARDGRGRRFDEYQRHQAKAARLQTLRLSVHRLPARPALCAAGPAGPPHRVLPLLA